MRRLAKLGDKTTNGYVASATSSIIDGKNLARNGDKAWCNECKGMFGIVGTARGWSEDSLFVGNGDKVACKCGNHQVIATSDLFDEAGESSQEQANYKQQLVNNGDNEEKEEQEKCPHSDGAIKVAEYILDEIKINVKSNIAKEIRESNSSYNKKYEEWERSSVFLRPESPPIGDLIKAMTIWYNTVKTKSIWDHKPKIRDKFSSVAVARPLPKPSNTPSKSYYHKYKKYDYFYDAWSNIHYGYVGLSVGFDEDLLLSGSTLEQNMTLGAMGDDTLDDVTTMKIGFRLFHQYGKDAENLTVQHILDALDSTPETSFPESKQPHWCWHSDNPKKIEQE